MKYDANHHPLSKRYEAQGCSVANCAKAGGGVFDIFVGCAGITHGVEFKTEAGRLEDSQKEFHPSWRGRFRIIRTEEEVDQHVKDMRAEARSLVNSRMLGPKRE